ncbi:MAG: hypothetical protein M1821_002503 [Bathelium mastoideum]|nr:MAG: hypothetical protein M1821_002503 [Bathelium mastoideum]
MPPLRFLCLHGAGTNAEANQLTRELSKDYSAEFEFIEGQISAGPGPGVSGIFDPPYYNYFQWPRTTCNAAEDDNTVTAAFEQIYEALDGEEGPFDGVLGFSHGATLAFSFLVHHAKAAAQRCSPSPPSRSLGLRCAVFIAGMPPFREGDAVEGKATHDGRELVFDDDVDGYIDIPSLTVTGRRDFVHEHSLRLAKMCGGPGLARLLVHDKGHEVPADVRNVRTIASAIRQLGQIAMVL